MDNILQNSLPIKDLIDKGIDWLTEHLAGLFKVIQVSGDAMMNFVSDTLNVIPPLLLLIASSLSKTLQNGFHAED